MGRFFACLVLLCVGLPVGAAQDLLATYDQALRNDPELLSAEAQVGVAEARYRQARGRLLPQLSANARYAQVTQSQEFKGLDDPTGVGFFRSGDGETTTDQQSYTFDLVQPLFNWTAWQSKDAAEARSDRARILLTAAEQDLIVRTAGAYFDVLAARDVLKATRERLEAIRRQLDRAEAAFQAGLAPITDKQEAQSSLDAAQVDAITAANELAAAREALRGLTGRAPDRLEGIAVHEPAALGADESRSREAWLTLAAENSLALMAARAALVAAQQEVAAAGGQRFPELALVGSIGRSEQLFPFGGAGQITTVSETYSIGVQLQMPIFSGGIISAEVAEAEYLAEQARLDVVAARRELLLNINGAYRNVRASADRVAALDQAIESARTAVAAARAGYRLGNRTILDVIEAETELAQRKAERKQAWYDFAVAQLQLRRAAGVLDFDELARINTHLDEPPAKGPAANEPA